jgi:hypothetical protein
MRRALSFPFLLVARERLRSAVEIRRLALIMDAPIAYVPLSHARHGPGRFVFSSSFVFFFISRDVRNDSHASSSGC